MMLGNEVPVLEILVFDSQFKRRMIMMRVLAIKRLIGLCGATVLIAAVCLGQAAPAKKAYTFHGKVEAVNAGANSLTVNGEKVEGWMDAMTMSYKVDDPSVL